MPKSKALIAAEAKIAALEARITVAKTVYLNQRARITELEAALNTRGVKAALGAAGAEPAPVVTHYTDHCGRCGKRPAWATAQRRDQSRRSRTETKHSRASALLSI